jgi:hypothetical protein
MALDSDKLKDNLESWLQGSYSTVAESADAFADAYYDYAKTANDVSLDIPLLTYKTNLANILKTLTLTETPNSAAIKYENAIIAFWAGATFTLLIPPTGTISPEISAIVTTNIVPGTISNPLTTIFSTLKNTDTYESKAIELASIFHSATLTIVVTCVGTLTNPPYSLAVSGTII